MPALMRGLPIRKLVAAIIVLTAVMSVILVSINWNGDEGSTAASKIDTLLDVMIVLSSFVFSIVMVMMAYSVWRWRAKPGDESDGAPIHDPNRMVVDVYAQQYEWHFNYPEQGVTSRELHVPLDRQIEFRMHALDVIHSFWVPEWRIKKDAVPGITTRAYITPDQTGDYTLVCTELCGIGHATMRAPVVVEDSQQSFDQWATTQPPIPSTEPKPGEVTPKQVRQ
jgi:cytochrome c oxidase subunit 2